ncbi:hypothetical protein LSH36_1798g00000 [Paralvinella palmiformis]|uniref:Uncharacterized protein n=1 Tax=Paralvinella palmiformis TaxID=53620 RepID=A0AAD9IS97_9ANNE|nr:hypothetical protein LSH36_1798g00000 [Paralvinella palmiformis]
MPFMRLLLVSINKGERRPSHQCTRSGLIGPVGRFRVSATGNLDIHIQIQSWYFPLRHPIESNQPPTPDLYFATTSVMGVVHPMVGVSNVQGILGHYPGTPTPDLTNDSLLESESLGMTGVQEPICQTYKHQEVISY